MIDNLSKYFYYNIGQAPTEEQEKITKNTIAYLIDAGLITSEIVDIIHKVGFKECLKISDLPDDLWNDSLLKKDVFYYHGELKIVPKPNGWDTESKFFLEMKIKFTIKDALDYFMNRFHINKEWFDIKKETGAITYLLNEYKKFSFVEPVDMFLNLCDYTFFNCGTKKITSIYDMRNFEIESAQNLQREVNNAKYYKTNKIIWRE